MCFYYQPKMISEQPWKLVFKDQFTGGLNQINKVFQIFSTNWLIALRSQWREEKVEMWMWGCKMIKTDRSWIRMCGHHMVSEGSAPRFVFRSRTSPACASEYIRDHRLYPSPGNPEMSSSSCLSLLWIDKTRVKDKRYKEVSVWWKTTN